ncbi:MAG: hypothetical protein COB51_10910 [Moraxellaceae bacterium]|nr:MAG: hypothetical protein COB51_10910 [Moraxellaceae bacterium]
MIENTVNPQQRRKNRLKLLCLVGLPVITVVLSTLMFKTGIGLPSGTKNKGALIQPPQQIADFPFTKTDGEPFDYAPDSKWSLLLPAFGECKEDCEKRLFLTRQVHMLLGKNADAVRRYYLNIEGTLSQQTLNMLKQDHPKLTVINTTREAIESLGGGIITYYSNKAMPYFLVDPRGFVMMYYTDQNTDKELIKDLKFLITKAGGH